MRLPYPAADQHDVVVQSWVRADHAELDMLLRTPSQQWIDWDWTWKRPDRVGR